MPARAASSSSTLAPAAAERVPPKAPATCGVAMDVPLQLWKALPGTEVELMAVPGASRLSQLALLEKFATVSVAVVAPTEMAVEIQPGGYLAAGRFIATGDHRGDTHRAQLIDDRLGLLVVRIATGGAGVQPPPRLRLTAATG